MLKWMTFLAASMLASAASAASYSSDPAQIRAGAFVGLRLEAPLGRHAKSKPKAGLALAPTRSRISSDGAVSTRIGEGLALNLSPGEPPRLGFGPGDREGPKRKLGLSTGKWVAIGAGVVVVAAVGFALWVDEIEDNSD